MQVQTLPHTGNSHIWAPRRVSTLFEHPRLPFHQMSALITCFVVFFTIINFWKAALWMGIPSTRLIIQSNYIFPNGKVFSNIKNTLDMIPKMLVKVESSSRVKLNLSSYYLYLWQ